MSLGPDEDTPPMGTTRPMNAASEAARCKRCGHTAPTIAVTPGVGFVCGLCSGLAERTPAAAHRALWVLERELAPGDWRPVPGASGPNEHAARNLAQALLLTTPGLSADTYRVQRYVPAPDGDE